MAIVSNTGEVRGVSHLSGKSDVDVVILAGTVGHESSWSHDCPRPVLPLPGTSIVKALMHRVQKAFDGVFLICANGYTDLLESHLSPQDQSRHGIRYYQDAMPRGTAGCLKACIPAGTTRTMFVVGGTVWLEDDPRQMVEQHRASGNALTVFCTEDATKSDSRLGRVLRPTGVYCCEPVVLEHIRSAGYQDIKEQLVPALRRAGLRAGTVSVHSGTGEVSDWASYLGMVARRLSDGTSLGTSFRQITPDVHCGPDVQIASTARIVGPAMIGAGCRIGEGAVIIGPTVLADGCSIGDRSWLVRVVTADAVSFGPGSCVVDEFIPYATREMVAAEEPGAQPSSGTRENGRPVSAIRSVALRRPWGMHKTAAAVVALAAMFLWAFESTLGSLWQIWQRNPDYSSGQLVPLCVLYMAMTRRESLRSVRIGFWPAGLLVFVTGLALHAFGGFYAFSSMQYFGMVVCINGLLMSLIGPEGVRRLWFPMLFLFLMLPLPHRVHTAVMLPLQTVCARISETILETIAVPVARFGHVLEVEGYRVAVAEACSGLRMALAFLIVTGVVAYVVNRPSWQKTIVLLSSIPIALACNVMRIVGAAYLYSVGYPELAQGAFHDGVGLLMMPIALGLIYLEFKLFSNLSIPQQAVAALVERVDRAQVASNG